MVSTIDFTNRYMGMGEELEARRYATACHGPQVKWQSPTFARQFGYHALPEQAQDISISRPEQIFDEARRIARMR